MHAPDPPLAPGIAPAPSFTPSSRTVAEPELSALLRGDPEAWDDAFRTTDEVAAWRNGLTTGGAKDTVFVIYDRSAGELLVSGTKRGRPSEKRFEVGADLAPVLAQARRFIAEQ